jgi:hypothetical protein
MRPLWMRAGCLMPVAPPGSAAWSSARQRLPSPASAAGLCSRVGPPRRQKSLAPPSGSFTIDPCVRDGSLLLRCP